MDPEQEKANMEPGMGWGLDMFCRLKLFFFYLKPAYRLEKNRIRGLSGRPASRVPRTVDPESEHGIRYGRGWVGPDYVLLIEIGFDGP